MKKWLLIFFALIPALAVLSQDSLPRRQDSTIAKADSIAAVSPTSSGASDDDNWLPYVMIIVAIGFVVVAGIGVLATLFLSGLTIVLTLAGIVSFSVIMGIYRRSLKAGVRWAVYLFFGVGGAGAGIAGYFIFLAVRKLHIHISTPVIVSAAAGLIGGLLCGAVFLFLLRRTVQIIQNRLPMARKIFE